MVIVMLAGGLLVTVLGLYSLSGDAHSLVAGWRKMVVLNQAGSGIWKEAVARTAPYIAHGNDYNRLSVIQPITHMVTPWPHILVGFLSISLWYNVGNQFMIQRVLGAKNIYHARMGIVLAGFLKIVLPLVIVVPGLILFALHPQAMLLPWKDIRPAADKGYVTMLQTLIPIGLRGLFLAALFGAIQSSLNAVINSTATIFTIDIYKRLLHPSASERHYVRVGVVSSVVVTIIGILLAPGISQMGKGLFVYIHTLFAFFAPPFASVFLLGILFRRINTPGATVTLFSGFAFAILVKLFVQYVPSHPAWIEPFAMQAFVVWLFCTLTCVTVSLLTPPPLPEKITDQLTFNWRTLNITQQLGGRWYRNVVFWWLVVMMIVLTLVILFSGLFI
jgi:SSS family solute:Na+ symporter